MVIAPARTGKDRSNKIAVIKRAQANKGVRSKNILPTTLMFCCTYDVGIKVDIVRREGKCLAPSSVARCYHK